MSELQSSASIVQSMLSGAGAPNLGIAKAPGTSGESSVIKNETLTKVSPGVRSAPTSKPTASKYPAKVSEDSSKAAVEAASDEGNALTASEAASTDETSESAPTPVPSMKEEIQITDARGRKTTLEVDYSNKESIKKAFQDVHNFQNGFRKMQAERDQLRSQLDKQLSELEPVKRNFELLDKAYQNSGVEGVIDLLEAHNGGYKKWLDSNLAKQEFRRNASPEEVKALDAQELADRYQREREMQRKEFDEFKKQIETEKAQAEITNMEASVTPIFEKYRFQGKLGDETDEKLFDKMLWRTTMDNLEEEYGSKDEKLTPEIIEDEFRVVAATLRKRIQNQVSKKTSQVIEKKKQNALENVQTQVKSEYADNSAKLRQEMDTMLDSGNVSGLISGWKKFSPMFNRKK